MQPDLQTPEQNAVAWLKHFAEAGRLMLGETDYNRETLTLSQIAADGQSATSSTARIAASQEAQTFIHATRTLCEPVMGDGFKCVRYKSASSQFDSFTITFDADRPGRITEALEKHSIEIPKAPGISSAPGLA